MRIVDTVYNYISDCIEYDESHGLNYNYNKKEIKSSIAKHIKCCKGSDVHAYSYYKDNEVSSVVLVCEGCNNILAVHK